MNTADRDAMISGSLFILAAVTSIIGLKLYDPLLLSTNYLITGYESENRVVSVFCSN